MRRALLLATALALAPAACGNHSSPDGGTGDAGMAFRAHLSDYPFFVGKLADQVPADGIVPYDVTALLYTDGASKLRFIRLPSDGKIGLDDHGRWQFPDGTTIIKTFYYPTDERDPSKGRRLLETRLLERRDGAWEAATYLWNDAQTEADLFLPGRTLAVEYTDTEGKLISGHYRVPAGSQCKQCHMIDMVVEPVGPRLDLLNRDYDFGADHGGVENQITHFVKLGAFEKDPGDPATLPKLADPHDEALPVAVRARAWLEANCAHCHNPQGYAASTGLYLASDVTDPGRYGVCKVPVAAGPGAGDLRYDVRPGDPEHSILVHRISSLDPKVQMPPLPLTTNDAYGVALIKQWISELDQPPCPDPDSTP